MNRFVLSVSRCLVPAFVTACLATASLAQQGPPGGLSVDVVNTPSVKVLNTPLPVTGTVAIVNPPNTPSPAVAISNPADIAKAMGVQHPVAFVVTSNNQGVNTLKYTVPPNQRLIIEYASGSCNLFNISLNDLGIVAKSNSNDFFFPVNLPTLATSNPQVFGNFAHLVRIYADPASVISLTSTSIASIGNNSSFSCFATLSGQLVDFP
jgi:hypothetical protein